MCEGQVRGLTARQCKVLELIGDGLTNRQIGERLSVTEKTVKNCVSVLFVKLGMEQRTQAAAYAARIFDGRQKLALTPEAFTTGQGTFDPRHEDFCP
jgi:DNA-binding CsgD family transcriptional regulator